MKLGEIKIEALKQMFTNYGFDINIENLTSLLIDENYASYLVAMNGSIARAIDRIENAMVVKRKVFDIPSSFLNEINRSYQRFDLSQIHDYFMIDRVICTFDNGFINENAEFTLAGDLITLPVLKGVTFSIVYFPKVKNIDADTSDTDELELEDKFARIIPYFIKGELYQEEEPALAADATNRFEALLMDFAKADISNQTSIIKVV